MCLLGMLKTKNSRQTSQCSTVQYTKQNKLEAEGKEQRALNDTEKQGR